MQSVVQELRRLDRVRTTVRSKGQVLSVYTLCAAVCVCQSIYRMCSIALPELDPPQCMCCCRSELAGAMFGGRLGLTCAVRVPCVWGARGAGVACDEAASQRRHLLALAPDAARASFLPHPQALEPPQALSFTDVNSHNARKVSFEPVEAVKPAEAVVSAPCRGVCWKSQSRTVIVSKFHMPCSPVSMDPPLTPCSLPA